MNFYKNLVTKVTLDRLNAIDSAILWNELYVWPDNLLSFKHGCCAKVLKIPHLSLVSLVKILQIKPVPQSQKVNLQWKWKVIDTSLIATIRSIRVHLLPRMPHSNSGKVKQTPITSCSAVGDVQKNNPSYLLPREVSQKNAETRTFKGGPNLFICALVMFLNRVFRQDLTDFHDF